MSKRIIKYQIISMESNTIIIIVHSSVPNHCILRSKSFTLNEYSRILSRCRYGNDFFFLSFVQRPEARDKAHSIIDEAKRKSNLRSSAVCVCVCVQLQFPSPAQPISRPSSTDIPYQTSLNIACWPFISTHSQDKLELCGLI